MKRLCLLSTLIILLSCSSDDDTGKYEIEYGNITLEFSDKKVHKPAWLKKEVSSQMEKGNQGDYFPGYILGIEFNNEKYILIHHVYSSNSCISEQIYELNGEKVSCESELQLQIASKGWKDNPFKILWDGFEADGLVHGPPL